MDQLLNEIKAQTAEPEKQLDLLRTALLEKISGGEARVTRVVHNKDLFYEQRLLAHFKQLIEQLNEERAPAGYYYGYITTSFWKISKGIKTAALQEEESAKTTFDRFAAGLKIEAEILAGVHNDAITTALLPGLFTISQTWHQKYIF